MKKNYLSAGFESRRFKRAIQTMYYMSSHCRSIVGNGIV